MLQNDQRDGDDHAGRDLVADFGARREAKVAAMNNFQIVIGKTNRTESDGGKHGDPNKGIAQVGPE